DGRRETLLRKRLRIGREDVDVAPGGHLAAVDAGQVAVRARTDRNGDALVQVDRADVHLGFVELDLEASTAREREPDTGIRRARPEGADVAGAPAGGPAAARDRGGEEKADVPHRESPPRLMLNVAKTPRGGPATKCRAGTSVGAVPPRRKSDA